MDEYIERESIIAHMKDLPTWWADDGGVYGKSMKYPDGMFDCEDVIGSLEGAPAADVEPVKRGHWICIGDIDEYIFECSECHEIYYLNEGTPKEHQYNYCPNCGAKLCKGEENNA